jgi:hypothetical protein
MGAFCPYVFSQEDCFMANKFYDFSDYFPSFTQRGTLILMRKTPVARFVSHSRVEFKTGAVMFRRVDQSDGTHRWEQKIAFSRRNGGFSQRIAVCGKDLTAALDAHAAATVEGR